ncbi:MAG: FG-GAP repeat protein, partial [Acidimicrobiia bacterium]
MRVGRVRLALAGGLAGAALLVGPAAVAQFVWDLETVLDPPEATDAFGRSVAIDGATLVTGAPSDDTLLPNSGAVWAHTRDPASGWQFLYKINS